MASDDFDTLINQANLLAESGKWQDAYQKLDEAKSLQPQNPGLLNGMGVCLLQLGKHGEAAEYFLQVVEMLPDLPEVRHHLGLAYAAMGDFVLAEAAYRETLRLDPGFRAAKKSLAVICIKQEERVKEGLEMLMGLIREDAQDIEAVLILANSFEEAEQYASAMELYQYVLKIDPKNNAAKKALEKLSAAVNLQGSAVSVVTSDAAEAESSNDALMGSKAVAFYAGFEFATAARLIIVAQALQRDGMSIKYTSEIAPQDLMQFDTFVFSRPHLKQEWVDAFQACMRAGKRIIIDIDEDFHNLPATHPGFDIVGRGHPMAIEIFERMLRAADVVTVSSAILADRYKSYTRRAEVIPSGWSSDNVQWNKPAPKHRTFNIGWIDLPTERDNLVLLKEEVLRFIADHPKALLVIGGDVEALKIFGELGADRALYVPFTSFDDYPYVLAQFDVLLCPVKRTPYGYARSDVRVMEAGIRRIPWIASKIPAYQEWGVGGIFVDRNGGWYRAIKQLYEDAELRQKLGEEGRLKAETRECKLIADAWKKIF